MELKLSELTNKLQDLCTEGLSELRVTVDGKDDVEIEYIPGHNIINIRRTHK